MRRTTQWIQRVRGTHRRAHEFFNDVLQSSSSSSSSNVFLLLFPASHQKDFHRLIACPSLPLALSSERSKNLSVKKKRKETNQIQPEKLIRSPSNEPIVMLDPISFISNSELIDISNVCGVHTHTHTQHTHWIDQWNGGAFFYSAVRSSRIVSTRPVDHSALINLVGPAID